LADWQALGSGAYASCNLTGVADLELRMGRPDAAHASADEAIRLARASGETFYLAESLRVRGEARMSLGQPSGAASDLLEAVALAEQQGARSFQLRAALGLNSSLPRDARPSNALGILRQSLAPFAGTTSEEIDRARAIAST
jgi:predicted ATPase